MSIHDSLNRAAFTGRLAGCTRAEARRRLGIDENDIVVVTIGTVCERKGQIDAIGAVRDMNGRSVSGIRWFIVGDRPGAYSSLLHDETKRLSGARSTVISMVPETPDAPVYYAAADIYCCTSRVETFPRVILEAMAAELPIVTTPVFGIVEQVKQGRNALFYHPGKTKDLANQISKLAEDSDLRGKMAHASPAVLDTLIDYDSWIDSYARILTEAWASGQPRVP